MADIVTRLVFDTTGAESSLDNYTSKVRTARNELNTFQEEGGEAFRETAKEADNLTEELDKGGKGLKEFAEKQKEATAAGKSFGRTLLDQTRGLKVFGFDVGSVIDRVVNFTGGLRDLAKAAKTSVPAIKGTNIAVKALYTTLTLGLAAVIGAVVTAVTSLAAAFARTQGGVEVFRVAIAGLTASFDVVLDRFAVFGSGLLSIIQGDLQGGLETIKGSFQGITEEIKNENAAAKELEKELIAIEKAETDLILARSKGREEIAFLRKDIENDVIASDIRIKKAQEALAIEQSIIQAEEDIARRRIANILAVNGQTEEGLQKVNEVIENNALRIEDLGLSFSTEDQRREVAEYIEQIRNLQIQSLNTQKEVNNQLNSIRGQAAAESAKAAEEERKKAEEIRKNYEANLLEFQNLVSGITGEIAKIDYENLSPRQQIIDDLNNKFAEIEQAVAQARAQAAALGEQLPQGFEEGIERIKKAAEDNAKAQLNNLNNTVKEVKKLEPELELPPLPPFIVEGEFFKKEDRKNIKDQLLSAFNINEEEFQIIEEAAKKATGVIVSSIQAATQAQIEQQDALISQLDNRISATQSALQIELELKKAGYANDFAAQKENLDKLQAAREQAEAKRIELAKKAARQQLLIDAAQQASSLATSAANFFQSNSKVPVVGIALAISAISTMFALFQRAKAIANQAAAPIELAEGMIGIPGASHDAQKRGAKVMRIEGTPYTIEGGESVINKRATAEHSGFLTALNDNKFKGVNLDAIGQMILKRPAMGKSLKRSVDTYQKGIELRTLAEMGAKGQVAELRKLQKQVKRLIELNESQTFIVPDGGLKKVTIGKNGQSVSRFK